MHTPEEHESHNKQASLREGYEVTDVSVRGILVFLTGLFISVGVFFVFCFGLGILINNGLKKSDGAPNKWNANTAASAGKLKNMESNPAAVQQQLQQLTQTFPTPRLQADDGNQDLADLHAREELLLDHYSWVDQSQGKIRIPIDRAMELIAQRGLPVAAKQASTEPLMAGDTTPVIQAPLTNGFTRSGNEQQETVATKPMGEQASTKGNN